MISQIGCPVSASGRCTLEPLGQATDRSGMIGEVGVMRCSDCGLGVSTPPIPDISILYEGRESQDYQPNNQGLAHAIKNVAFRRRAKRMLKQIGTQPVSLLDFGCGSGQFTRILGDLIGPSKVVGSDFHNDPPADLVGRPYLPMSGLQDHKAAFDVVLLSHVLEHDDNPLTLLQEKVLPLVKPGGLIVAEVPNIDCIWARPFGAAWDGWYIPYHRLHFSREAFRGLFASAGLQTISEIDISVPTMGRTFANMARQSNTLPWLLLGVVLQPVQWLGEMLSGQPSALRFIARVPRA